MTRERKAGGRVSSPAAALPRAFADAGVKVDPVAEAYERGRAEGLAVGRKKARAKLAEELDQTRAELQQRLAETLTSLGTLRDRLDREYVQSMRELAIEVASRIVRERIDEGDPVAARALDEALSALPESQDLVARIHPDDVAGIREHLEKTPTRAGIELVEDPAISRGGCVLESSLGTVDARVETATSALRNAVDGKPETS